VGRTEEVVGEAYGDAAAEVHGEAVRLRGEAEEDAERASERHGEQAVADRTGLAAEDVTVQREITDG
jgi:uncharacterized protein YjbJ (UPF0337 family)